MIQVCQLDVLFRPSHERNQEWDEIFCMNSDSSKQYIRTLRNLSNVITWELLNIQILNGPELSRVPIHFSIMNSNGYIALGFFNIVETVINIPKKTSKLTFFPSYHNAVFIKPHNEKYFGFCFRHVVRKW